MLGCAPIGAFWAGSGGGSGGQRWAEANQKLRSKCKPEGSRTYAQLCTLATVHMGAAGVEAAGAIVVNALQPTSVMMPDVQQSQATRKVLPNFNHSPPQRCFY